MATLLPREADALLAADSATYMLTSVTEHLHGAVEGLLPALSEGPTACSLIQLGRVLGLVELAQSEATRLEAALMESTQDG